MGIYAIKPAFQRTLAPVTRWCIANQVSPTLLNALGLVASALMAACLILSSYQPLILLAIPPLAFVRTALNALDGLVSREMGTASGWGELLNEFLDRLSDTLIFLPLFLVPGVDDVAVLGALALILLNSYLSIASKAAGGVRLYGGAVGKADRMIYLSITSVLVVAFEDPRFFTIFLLAMMCLTAVTLLQRLAAARRALLT